MHDGNRRVEIAIEHGVAIVSLIGEHDLAGWQALRRAFMGAAIRAPDVLVDLSACEFIDSTVIRMLLHAETVVRRDGGRLVVALPADDSPVARVAELVKLARLIPTYASVGAALASLDPRHGATAPGMDILIRWHPTAAECQGRLINILDDQYVIRLADGDTVVRYADMESWEIQLPDGRWLPDGDVEVMNTYWPPAGAA